MLAASTADVVADLRSWLNEEPAQGAKQYEGMFDLAGLLESLLLMWGMKAVM